MSVSTNGEVRVQKGATITASPEGQGFVAIAKGVNSTATASGGDHNKAFVTGDNSSASATATSANTARVTGDGSQAAARTARHMACAGNGSLRYEMAA